jgi:hypothetical protein
VREPLTPKQHNLVAFIRRYSEQHGYAPTYEEIRRELGYRSLATVHEHIRASVGKGYLRQERGRPRSLRVIGEEEPEHPSVLGQFAANGTVGAEIPLRSARAAISADGLRAYLSHSAPLPDTDPYAGGPGTLTIFDLSSPAQPRVASRVDFERQGWVEIPVVASGDQVVVLTGTEGGLLVVDASRPERPTVLARHTLPRVYAEGLAADAGHVYVGAWEDGLLIYELPTTVRQ